MCIFCCTFASANRQLQIDFLDHFYKYNYMTQNLSHISHVAPPDVPSEEDLQFEVQDLLRHANSPIDVLQKINQITCPYYRKALAQIVPIHWHHMERNGIEPAVYMDADSEWRITWINIDYDIRKIIKQANTEQVEREQQEQSSIEKTVSITTKTTTFMPLFINKQEGNITNNHYENCVINNYATPAPTETEENNTPSVVAEVECTTTNYSTYLRRQLGLGKSDDEVQNNLKNAAQEGATELARYLTSNEGKIYFDFRGQNKSKIISTLNQELGTAISEKAFCAALNRNGLQL